MMKNGWGRGRRTYRRSTVGPGKKRSSKNRSGAEVVKFHRDAWDKYKKSSKPVQSREQTIQWEKNHRDREEDQIVGGKKKKGTDLLAAAVLGD